MAIADKEQALHQFWAGFGWVARDENTVPDDAMSRYGGHYITYNVATAAIGEPVPLSADLWAKDTSWTEITAKAEEIAQAIGIGGKLIQFPGGYLWICRGVPFSQRLGDEDETIRRIGLNIMAEFLSAD
jgi:hypothetical protein